jgi:hypothetical protein
LTAPALPAVPEIRLPHYLLLFASLALDNPLSRPFGSLYDFEDTKRGARHDGGARGATAAAAANAVLDEVNALPLRLRTALAHLLERSERRDGQLAYDLTDLELPGNELSFHLLLAV